MIEVKSSIFVWIGYPSGSPTYPFCQNFQFKKNQVFSLMVQQRYIMQYSQTKSIHTSIDFPNCKLHFSDSYTTIRIVYTYWQ